jgi:hypothetical protein
MSFDAQLAVILASRQPDRFSHAEFRVLMNLAEHHNGETGRCDPSLKLLEEETGMDRGYLRRILGALEDRGEIGGDSGKGGRGHRRQYDLLLKGDRESPFVAAERVTPDPRKSDTGHHQRVTGRSADLGKRDTTRNRTRKNQRGPASSTPNGAGRARVDNPTTATEEEMEAAVKAAIARGATT